MIVDTSVILAVYFNEPRSAWAAEQLTRYSDELSMSTVSLTEVMIHLRDRQPTMAEELEDRLLSSGMRFVPPDEAQARIAAIARLSFPLNLGDCFVYALSVVENCGILSLDEDFRQVGRPVVLPEA